jgi:hypothetical protein
MAVQVDPQPPEPAVECYQTTVPAVIAGTPAWDGVTPFNEFCK